MEILTSLTVTSKPFGAPRSVGLSESEYWVFATQTGSLSPPRATTSASAFSACGVKFTLSAP